MSARHKARKRALDLLFEAEARNLDAAQLLAERLAAADPPVPPYAAELVEGVTRHLVELDAALAPALAGAWTLERLPAVDRSVLRIALYELRFRDDVPVGVAISEAVTLAADLSTDESPRYINGVLTSLAEGQAPAPVA